MAYDTLFRNKAALSELNSSQDMRVADTGAADSRTENCAWCEVSSFLYLFYKSAAHWF